MKQESYLVWYIVQASVYHTSITFSSWNFKKYMVVDDKKLQEVLWICTIVYEVCVLWHYVFTFFHFFLTVGEFPCDRHFTQLLEYGSTQRDDLLLLGNGTSCQSLPIAPVANGFPVWLTNHESISVSFCLAVFYLNIHSTHGDNAVGFGWDTCALCWGPTRGATEISRSPLQRTI